MTRFANGSSPTDECRASPAYDAGFRDGYRTAQQRANAELAALHAQIEKLVMAITAAKTAAPIVFTISAERANHLLEDLKHEGE